MIQKQLQHKKNNLSDKWTKQQKENFEQFGDIWYQEPYKNYHVSDWFQNVTRTDC